MNTLPSRLFPVAKIVFDALNKSGAKGIIIGGAAMAMNGSECYTRDVDINVTAFPKLRDSETILARVTTHNMMKVTYLHPTDAVKCDMVTKPANLMSLFLKYSLQDEKLSITCAGPALLLADKIHTYADRGETRGKRLSDLEDIVFCMSKMYENAETMPNELKSLYTAEDWNKVLEGFEMDEDNGGHYKELAQEVGIRHMN